MATVWGGSRVPDGGEGQWFGLPASRRPGRAQIARGTLALVALPLLVFLADLVQEFYFEPRLGHVEPLYHRFVDTALSTALIAPLLWFLLLRPLVTAGQALQESAAHFRQIFDLSDDGIVMVLPEGGAVVEVNATAQEMFGFSRQQLMESGLSLLSPEKERDFLHDLLRRVESERGVRLVELTSRRRDGSEIVSSVKAKLMNVRGEEVICCTFRDITQKIRLEQEARDIQARLIQANKMSSLELLVSGVAHEINNPNNVILANTQLLARTWKDVAPILESVAEENGAFQLGGLPVAEVQAQAPRLFQGIELAARRIGTSIETLKGFAREELGGEPGDVDLNQVATSAVSLLHHELGRHTDHFHLELAPQLPHFRGKRRQLGQVIVNLLMNAWQALPNRECGIWLATGYEADAGEVVISVRDEGKGIDPEHRSKIMEPFFTTKIDAGGTGLGLSICRSIVKDHHGELAFESEPGKGSRFMVKIPVQSGSGELSEHHPA